eukprot:m.137515 g.137515  ORF g.137515 m.137515 type:complete len:166 (+) comp29924_c0_seq2:2184-2681(+)
MIGVIQRFFEGHLHLIRNGSQHNPGRELVGLEHIALVLSCLLYCCVGLSYEYVDDKVGFYLFLCVGTFSAVADGNLINSPEHINEFTHVLDRIFATLGGVYFVFTVLVYHLTLLTLVPICTFLPLALGCLTHARTKSNPHEWVRWQILWHMTSAIPMILVNIYIV